MARKIGPDTAPSTNRPEPVHDPVQEAFFLKDLLLIHKKVFSELSKNADALVIFMHYYAGAKWKGDKLIVKMAVDDLWKTISISKDRIRAARNWLKKKKLIWDVMVRTENGQRVATSMVGINLYPPGSQEYREYVGYITISNILKDPKPEERGLGGVCNSCSSVSEKKEKNPPKKKDYRYDLFEELYSSHPRPKRKDNKQGGRRAWTAQHSRRPTDKDPRPPLTKYPDDLIRSVHAHCVKDVWDKPEYVPMFQTWINNFDPSNYPELTDSPAEKERDLGVDKDLDTLAQYRDHIINSEGAKQVRQNIQRVGSLSRYFAWLSRKVEEGEVEGITMEAIYPGHLFASWAEEMEEG